VVSKRNSEGIPGGIPDTGDGMALWPAGAIY